MRQKLIFTFALSFLFLTACNTVQSPQIDAEPDYIFTVDLTNEDTEVTVLNQYGGEILHWEANDYAVIGQYEGEQVNLASLSVRNRNKDVFATGAEFSSQAGINGSSSFWAGGSSSFWAGGSSSFWAGGSSSFWAGGSYAWMPENTAVWQKIKLDKAHEISSNLGLGVKIAVIDTGIDVEHPALQDALAPKSEWVNFVSKNALADAGTLGVDKGTGHGTVVAGIIRQIAPRATILPIKVFGKRGMGSAWNIAKAINHAVDMDVDVINLSLGSANYYPSIQKALTRAAKADVMIVMSSGNEGKLGITFPASKNSGTYETKRLSVSSVNQNDIKSSFSNFESTVDIVAPGEKICGPAPKLRQACWSGTSMAAPIITGTYALGLSEKSGMTVDALHDYLKSKSEHGIYSISNNQAYKNNNGESLLGEGRVNVYDFLQYVVDKKAESF